MLGIVSAALSALQSEDVVINDEGEEVVREINVEEILKFLAKSISIMESSIPKDIKDLLIRKIKKILELTITTHTHNFVLVMDILDQYQVAEKDSEELVEMVTKQCLSQPFDPADTEKIDHIIILSKFPALRTGYLTVEKRPRRAVGAVVNVLMTNKRRVTR